MANKSRRQCRIAHFQVMRKIMSARLDALEADDGVRALKLISEAPENLDAKEATGRVALHYAAEAGDTLVFRALLSADASLINAADECGFTPLFVAATATTRDARRAATGRRARRRAGCTRHVSRCTTRLRSPMPTLTRREPPRLSTRCFVRRRRSSIVVTLTNERLFFGRLILASGGARGRELCIFGAVDRDVLNALYSATNCGYAPTLRLLDRQCGRRAAAAKKGDSPLFYA